MTVSPSVQAGHSAPFRNNPWKGFVSLMVRRRWLILSCMVLGVVLGGAWTFMKEEMYRSWSVLLIEWPVGSVQAGSSGLAEHQDRERVTRVTQQVFSRSNLQKIIDELHLFPKLLKERGYEFTIENFRSHVEIQMKENGGKMEALSLSFDHHNPQTARRVIEKLVSNYIEGTSQSKVLRSENSSEILSQELTRAKEMIAQKEEELSAFQIKHADGLLEKLPENIRIRDRLQDNKLQIQKAINGLQFQLEQLRGSIRDHEFRLIQASLPSNQLNGEELQVLASRLISLKNALSAKSGELDEDHPEIIGLTKKINITSQELESRLRNGGDDVAMLSAKLSELKDSQLDMNRQLDDLQVQLGKVTRSARFFEDRIEQTPHRQKELLDLERDYVKVQADFERLNKQWIDAKIIENLNARKREPEFRVLDPASSPTQAEGIFRAWIPLGGYIFGAGLGLGVALILDWLSPTFRRPEDVELSLGIQTLATIPSFHLAYGKSMKSLSGAMKASPGNGALTVPGQQKRDYFESDLLASGALYGGKSPERSEFPPQLNLVARWRPQSIVAEHYRIAATRLDHLGEGDQCTVVLVTSSKKGEGKTSTSSNLAYTLARDLDEPTLVIDCDYKCPNLHNLFGVNPWPGVAEFLAGQESLEACLKPISDVPLWCMPVGNLEQNPVSLSKLQKLSLILATVKSRYRYIILDGPPILPLADMNILSALANIVLMVVRFGATPKDVVQKAVEMIQFRGPTRLVLTDAETQGIPSYATPGHAATPLLVSRHP